MNQMRTDGAFPARPASARCPWRQQGGTLPLPAGPQGGQEQLHDEVHAECLERLGAVQQVATISAYGSCPLSLRIRGVISLGGDNSSGNSHSTRGCCPIAICISRRSANAHLSRVFVAPCASTAWYLILVGGEVPVIRAWGDRPPV